MNFDSFLREILNACDSLIRGIKSHHPPAITYNISRIRNLCAKLQNNEVNAPRERLKELLNPITVIGKDYQSDSRISAACDEILLTVMIYEFKSVCTVHWIRELGPFCKRKEEVGNEVSGLGQQLAFKFRSSQTNLDSHAERIDQIRKIHYTPLVDKTCGNILAHVVAA